MATRIEVASHVVLRSVTLEDAETLFRIVDAERERLREWLPWVDETRSADDTRTFVEISIANEEEGKGLAVAIEEAGAIRGVLGLDPIDARNRSAQIGYWLRAEAEGRGLMTRCVAALVEHAFSDLDLNRLEIRAGIGNLRSRAVPERLGFREEGIQREGERHADRFVDLACYALLRRDRLS